ncbi:hypothetical protein IWX91DRAFT_107186 [Phyllosticta citricarpa]
MVQEVRCQRGRGVRSGEARPGGTEMRGSPVATDSARRDLIPRQSPHPRRLLALLLFLHLIRPVSSTTPPPCSSVVSVPFLGTNAGPQHSTVQPRVDLGWTAATPTPSLLTPADARLLAVSSLAPAPGHEHCSSNARRTRTSNSAAANGQRPGTLQPWAIRLHHGVQHDMQRLIFSSRRPVQLGACVSPV